MILKELFGDFQKDINEKLHPQKLHMSPHFYFLIENHNISEDEFNANNHTSKFEFDEHCADEEDLYYLIERNQPDASVSTLLPQLMANIPLKLSSKLEWTTITGFETLTIKYCIVLEICTYLGDDDDEDNDCTYS